jgi:hypothetical protein
MGDDGEQPFEKRLRASISDRDQARSKRWPFFWVKKLDLPDAKPGSMSFWRRRCQLPACL